MVDAVNKMVSKEQVVGLCSYIVSAIFNATCLSHGAPLCQLENSERAICPSFDAIIDKIPPTNWKKLNVINSGNVQLSIIRRGTFENYNKIDDLQVKNLANGLETRAFDGLTSLHELHLDDNNLEAIIPGVFDHLPIADLYIYNCGIKRILPRSFYNLPKLKSLNIYGNHINTIEENIFTGTRVTLLMLRKNHIRNVEANAFARMPFLEFLSLEENELTEFNTHVTIGFAPKLLYFYINRNELRTINKDMFNVMPLLNVLLLNINNIERIDDFAFEELPDLRLLDISNNELVELPPNVFKAFGHEKMKLLFIHNNKLTFLNIDLLARLPNLNSISMEGNPWQCPCYRLIEFYLKNNNASVICREEYNKGSRPHCTFSKYNPGQCVYDVHKVKDLVEEFEEALKEYGKLPPVCNVDGTETPKLGYK